MRCSSPFRALGTQYERPLSPSARWRGSAWAGGASVRVRIGLHTGEAQVVEDDYVGAEVHRAARICAAAHGGQVVLSQSTENLVSSRPISGASVRELGEYLLKDFDSPSTLYQLDIDGLDSEFPGLRAARSRVVSVPREPSSLVGRERELGMVEQLILEERLVTLTGAGGSGKTRLALRAASNLADREPGSVVFVRMASFDSADQVPPAISQAFGLEGIVSGWDQLPDVFGQAASMLVLDNAEHLASLPDQISTLLDVCPGLRVVITSRIPLAVAGERLYPVEPLDQGDAVELLIERARAHHPEYTPLPDQRAVLAEIADRLAGLPLALELAAARLRAVSPEMLAANLDRQLDILKDDRRGDDRRQQTMRRTIEWSYQLLSAEDRGMFEDVAVFAAPAALDAVAAVTQKQDLDVLDGLTRLLDASLVRLIDHGADQRYNMLEPIRQYASERLAARDDAAVARRRMLDWYIGIGRHLLGFSTALLTLYRDDGENINRAFSYAADAGDWESVAVLYSLTFPALLSLGQHQRVTHWHTLAKDHEAELSGDALSRILQYQLTSWGPSYASDLKRAVELTESQPSSFVHLNGLERLVQCGVGIYDYDLARSAAVEFRDKARFSDHPTIRQMRDWSVAVEVTVTELTYPVELWKRVVDQARQIEDDDWQVIYLLGEAGFFATALDRSDIGLPLLLEGFEIASALDLVGLEVQYRDEIIRTALGARDSRLALQHEIAAAETVERHGVGYLIGLFITVDDWIYRQAGVLAACGRLESAALLAGRAEEGNANTDPARIDVHLIRPVKREVDEARSKLGADRWAELEQQGRALTAEAAVQLGREQITGLAHEAAAAGRQTPPRKGSTKPERFPPV